MGRSLRPTSAGVVYHVLNRANARRRLFDDDGDYAAFERVLTSACARVSMRLLAYCAMPNHWHLVVWPRHDGDLSRFMNWLTLTHTQCSHQHRHTVGEGHMYQGRFKSFPVETSEYLLTVVGTWNATPCGQTSWNERSSGAGAVLELTAPSRYMSGRLSAPPIGPNG
jgi:putative transposase